MTVPLVFTGDSRQLCTATFSNVISLEQYMILPTVQALLGGLLYSDDVRIHLCNPYIRVSTHALIRIFLGMQRRENRGEALYMAEVHIPCSGN